MLYLCDTDICNSVLVATGLLVGLKQNCAPSWTYLRDYTRIHGQQNMKK